MAEFCSSTLSFAARERDVGMVGAILRREATRHGRGGDRLLKREYLGRNADIDEEDSGAIESVDCAKLDNDRRLMQFAKARGDAFVLMRRGAAEELQRDVPGFRRGPAQETIGCSLRAKAIGDGHEVVRCRSR